MGVVEKLSALKVARTKKAGYHLDGAGLYLQVTGTGAKSWILKFKLHGKSHEMGLGSLSKYTLSEARARAKKYRQLLDDGINPIHHRDGEKKARALESKREKPQTFEQVARRYIKLRAKKWRSEKHADQWTNTLTTYAFPAFGSKLVNDVTQADVEGVLEEIWSSKTETATRLQQRIRAILNWSAAKGWRPDHDGSMWEQLKKSLEPHATKKRQHFVACPWKAVPAVLATVRDSSAADAVKLLLEFVVLTACRTGEARCAEWSEIDLATNTWTIPKERTKSGREHRVPLSGRAVEILTAARALHAGDVVFPSPINGGPMSNMTCNMQLRRLNYEFVTHGFRSSFRDWAAEATAFPREVAEKALAHVIGDKTEAAYRRGDLFEKRREMMQAWAQHCAAKP